MSTSRLSHLRALAAAAIALANLTGLVAHADDAVPPEATPAFVATLSRADTRPGALQATQTATLSPLVAQETAPAPSAQPADRQAVVAAAVAAERADRIPYGQMSGQGLE